jgi:hypothetical protein
MKLVASRVRSTAEVPSVSAKPYQSALPTIFQRRTVNGIRTEIGQSHHDVTVFDAFRLLEQPDLAITIDTLNGSRHDRLDLELSHVRQPSTLRDQR